MKRIICWLFGHKFIYNKILDYTCCSRCFKFKENSKGYTLIKKYHCSLCGEDFGLTNLEYKGCQFWVGCGCMKDNKVYFVNGKDIKEEYKRLLSD